MKKLIYLLTIAYVVSAATGCNFLSPDDDDPMTPDPVELPPLAEDFIAENFSSYFIYSADTEDLCDNTLVWEVELEDGSGPDVDLYFALDGTFLFTSTEIGPMNLPEAVQNAIGVDFMEYSVNEQDVNRYVYPDGTIEYALELIHQVTGEEEDAVFTPNGELLCFEDDSEDDDGDGNEDDDDDGDDEDDDDDGDDDNDDDDGDDDNEDEDEGDDGSSEANIPEEVRDFIVEQYSGYLITSAEYEDICDDILMYEVELEDGPGPDLDLYFSLDWVFLFSEIEISIDQLPAAVVDAIAANYADYQIDEDKVEQLEQADGTLMYAVELESSEDDVEVIFNADGSIYCEDQ